MPILWRYLISQFLKIIIACTLAFIAILLTMRLDEIAHFAGLGAPLKIVLLFTLYQIPYIIPIALPLSCLIASFLLIKRLSLNHELVAMRACGFSLREIITPFLLTAALLAILNFWFVSELATYTHLKTNILKTQVRAINPLLLLNNKHLMKLKGFYFDTFGENYIGESSQDVLLAIPNRHQERIQLLVAKQVKVNANRFVGEEVTLVTNKKSLNEQDFDDLIIENIKKTDSSIQDFSDLLQKKIWTINNDYLQLPLLLTRIQQQKYLIQDAKAKGVIPKEVKILQKHLNRCYTDILKRFSIAIAVVTFTLMGVAFGLHIGRVHNTQSLKLAIFLTTFYLMTFFAAKGCDTRLLLSAVLYLVPHMILIYISYMTLKRISQGYESC